MIVCTTTERRSGATTSAHPLDLSQLRGKTVYPNELSRQLMGTWADVSSAKCQEV